MLRANVGLATHPGVVTRWELVTRTTELCALLLSLAALGPACTAVYHVDPLPSDAPSDAHPDATTTFDRCAFQGYDDPLRYATVTSPPGAPLTWDAARAACIRLGMDLEVFNDAQEIGRVDADAWPAWVGVSQASATSPWVSVDGCPALAPDGKRAAVLGVAAAPPAACGLVATANAVATSTCDGVLASGDGPVMITRALCETPRPEVDGCVRDPDRASYQASPQPLAYADAVTYCQSQQMHLIVIDTEAELAHVSKLVPVIVDQDFWVGERWDGALWRSETACPGEFSWGDGGAATATLGAGASCAAQVVALGPAGDPDNPPVLAMRGEAIAACDTLKIALCEKE